MIDDLDSFKRLIFSRRASHSMAPYEKIIINSNLSGEMYCPKCGDNRRMSVEPAYFPLNDKVIGQLIISQYQFGKSNEEIYENIIGRLAPSLWEIVCVQCLTYFTALIYKGAQGQAMAVFPSCSGGLTTPNTPRGVAFYLDQAHKAKSVGANSAAIAMFRSALENILFEQGYTSGMLNAKINKLVQDIEKETAPKWTRNLEIDFLTYLKDLGNGAIHPNDGDVERQSVLDNQLLAKVTDVFRMLLFVIYEEPSKKEKLLTSFREKAAIFK